ncbi:MAG TPA: pyridoxamine 5'-phosphate oxidase family protein [Streptosporangiaceae bacterium]|nr:pyridoxamine 5'-phosphate oxidase family protein [Streptosporangiaceae bacterium]
MYESEAELGELQVLLDDSLARATAHLRSIIRPGERTLTAPQLVNVISGMCTLAVSSVTARCEPRVSGADGHFLHGRWIFSTLRSSAKARQFAARPAVSLAHLRGDDFGVFAHGTVEVLNPAEGPDDPQWPAVLEHLTRHYGSSPLSLGDVVCYRVRPHWMVAFAADPASLLAEGD